MVTSELDKETYDFDIIGNPSNIVLSEVLQIVGDKIKDDEWEKLANYIGITTNTIHKIDTQIEKTSSKMMKCFEQKNDNITWTFLKTQLQKINRLDIIEIIKNETLLTIGKFFSFFLLMITALCVFTILI